MGRLEGGTWKTSKLPADRSGRFIRQATQFRSQIRRDGTTEFPAVAGRYHLYASWACPWAHRTLIVRKLRRLEDTISLSIVGPFMGDGGWEFTREPGTFPDTLHGARYLAELYVKAKPDYTGRVTVPLLWDRQQDTAVNNESREVMRMFDREFADLGDPNVQFCPAGLEDAIDEIIDALYQPINNGVYRCGFAGSQEAYDEAAAELFDALDRWDTMLATRRYLLGHAVTEADWCLFTTLFRFDLVYHYHFKCNLKRLRDYPNLWNYTKDLYQIPGVRETCHVDHIREHYYRSHSSINPRRIVPIGPQIDFMQPHDRDRVGPRSAPFPTV